MNIMKVPPYQTNAAESAAAADGKSSAQGKTAAATGVASDRVQLSQNYVDLANAQKSLAGTDEVRTDKVQQIKSQLESGNYRVNPQAVAGKMIEEMM